MIFENRRYEKLDIFDFHIFHKIYTDYHMITDTAWFHVSLIIYTIPIAIRLESTWLIRYPNYLASA